MSDRELLEAAARAAGVEGEYYEDPPGIEYWTGEPGTYASHVWNPLTDDGDALRLAVKLDLNIFPTDMPGRVCVEDGGDTMAGEPHGDDKFAATRRAIVRAAAALGDDK